jgi:hypothetical protein
MGEVIELPYRRVPLHIIEKLITTGYLSSMRRHEVATVLRAWENFRRDNTHKRIGGHDPNGSNLA